MRLLIVFNAFLALFLIGFNSFAYDNLHYTIDSGTLETKPIEAFMVVDDSAQHVSIENMCPIGQIYKESSPQLIVARIIGKWGYDYDNMQVYLAEYGDIRFVVYPNERDNIWAKYNLPEIEEETKDTTPMSLDDYLRFFTEHKGDSSLYLEDIDVPYNPPFRMTTPLLDSLDDSRKKNDPVKDIKLGQLYFFVVEPCNFREKGLRPYIPRILKKALLEAKYCFRALNLKEGRVYLINGTFFQKKSNKLP